MPENHRKRRRADRRLSNWRLRKSVEELNSSIHDLRLFQAKSSSVETIFTLAILGFTFVQATSYSIPENQAKTLVAVASGWALILGGPNLIKTTFESLKKTILLIYVKIVYSLHE